MGRKIASDRASLPKDAVERLRSWCRELGFDAVGVSRSRLRKYEARLCRWLDAGMHGEMAYMQAHGVKRSRPAALVPGTVSVISVRMNYLPADAADPGEVLRRPEKAYISRYALGRDYHRLIRKRLQNLADRITGAFGQFGYRAFCDSAPVLEKPLAEQAGLGWIGKHTVLINRNSGSWFFLGELYTDLPLPPSEPASSHCGSCRRCLDICPTGAIVAPYKLDARRCISYLTIELKGSIPVEFRPLLGNRIYGCDDCQLICPWNRFAKYSREPGFRPRHDLDSAGLLNLFRWNSQEFERRLAGSPIRRIGYRRWLRNIAVALGNAPYREDIVAALAAKRNHPCDLIREHVRWALRTQAASRKGGWRPGSVGLSAPQAPALQLPPR